MPVFLFQEWSQGSSVWGGERRHRIEDIWKACSLRVLGELLNPISSDNSGRQHRQCLFTPAKEQGNEDIYPPALSVMDQGCSLVIWTPGTPVCPCVKPDASSRKAFRKNPRCYQLENLIMVGTEEIWARYRQHLRQLLSGYIFVCAALSCSVVSDSLQPTGLEPARVLRPWGFSGKNTGVGCYFLLQEI